MHGIWRAPPQGGSYYRNVDAVVVLLAFAAGLGCRRLGYPPLPGYLLAGFAAHGLGLGDLAVIQGVADLGLFLLLFTIGLKLDFRELAAPAVWGVAGTHILIAVPLTALVILVAALLLPAMAIEGWAAAWTLALALSFSSTVLAVKVFDDRGEMDSYHARIAIGILVIQDLIAVVYLVAASGGLPQPWALALLGLVALRPALVWLSRLAQHGELLLLFGFALALGGAALFEAADLKGGLGALALGLILANTPRARELYKGMAGLKDLFLIGFFLQIGYYGLPTGAMWLVAGALCLLIGLRPLIYFGLFTAFKLRARTALLGGASLFSYSEFGLIVASVAVGAGLLTPEWLTTIALAVTMSFFLATPLNTRIHWLYSRYEGLLRRLERRARLPAERLADLGDAEIVILGMGRVGQGAFDALREELGERIVGVEENRERLARHLAAGYNCVHGDATDYDFWAHSGLKQRRLVLVSLANHQENRTVVELAGELGYQGQLAVVSRFPDERAELEALGCISFNLYGEAGRGFAEHVLAAIKK